MLRKLKWQNPGEPLAARYNWCQGPVPGRGPAVEKHWSKWHCFAHVCSIGQPCCEQEHMLTLYTALFLNPWAARFELSTKSDLITITNMSDPTVNIVQACLFM